MRGLVITAAAMALSLACGGRRKTIEGGPDGDVDADSDSSSASDTTSGSDSDVSSDTDRDCIDDDGDGYGQGDECRGADPDDTNPCDPDPMAHDCPCDEIEPMICYEGPEGTRNIGLCSTGMKGCVAGHWGNCVGQILPTVEECDGVDNNCDRAIDEHCTL